MNTSDFAYPLPPELIAAEPLARRDASRLLMVDRASKTWRHGTVADLPSRVRPGDAWVFNDSRVIPARFVAAGGAEELLLLEETSPRHWLCLASPGKRTRAGARFVFRSRSGGADLTAEVVKTLDTGERVVRFHTDFDPDDYGEMPLPPYILKARADHATHEADRERYQTVYAREAGSVAAPTAGLHFTPEMLERMPRAFVTLHVGLGTFRPVKTERLEDHEMHEERYRVEAAEAAKIAAAQRVVAVGTTSVRVLESLPRLQGGTGRTRIFIHPPYEFRHVQAMLTNFHLPKSTLFMLVCAFLGDTEFARACYAEAVKERYRFFSYGDAMLIE